MKGTRKKYDAKFKAKVALEAIKERETLNELAVKYEVSPVMISRWKKEFIENSAAAFETPKVDDVSIEKEKNSKSNNLINRTIMKAKLFIFALISATLLSCNKEEQIDDICAQVTDVIFKRHLIENFDFNKDSKVSLDEAALCTSLAFADEKVSNLNGIEYLTNLRELDCNFCKMSSLDLSKNTVLTTLDCSFCNLTSLNISKCTELKNLNCNSNKLTSLDVSNNTKLTKISCRRNNITTLDFTKNTSLIDLYCGSEAMNSINVAGLSNLSSLDCSESNLTSIDLTGCTKLEEIVIYENKLTALDISSCPKLHRLVCQKNQIETLDLSYGDFPNCPSLYVPLKANDMPTLKTVYLKNGWKLRYINVDRSTKHIPATTEILYK